ncbi:MAG: hypothetical protein AAGF11_37980 [Myxococcota bacterium]
MLSSVECMEFGHDEAGDASAGTISEIVSMISWRSSQWPVLLLHFECSLELKLQG